MVLWATVSAAVLVPSFKTPNTKLAHNSYFHNTTTSNNLREEVVVDQEDGRGNIEGHLVQL